MRWIMNALVMWCSLSLGLSSLSAQTPDAAAGGQASGSGQAAAGGQTAGGGQAGAGGQVGAGGQAAGAGSPRQGNQSQQGANARQNAEEAFLRGTPNFRGAPPTGAAGGTDRPGSAAANSDEAFRRGTPGFRGAPPTGGTGSDRLADDAEGATGGSDDMSRLPLVMALDPNGDGEISTEEIDRAVTALKTLDKNNDGRLTMDELMSGGPRGSINSNVPINPTVRNAEEMTNRMMMADVNSDGFIDQEEMPGRMKVMMLDRGDTDKDGQLSREEIIRIVAQLNRPGRAPIRDERGDRDASPNVPSNGADEPERPRRTRGD